MTPVDKHSQSPEPHIVADLAVPSLIQAYRAQEQEEKICKRLTDSTILSAPTSPYLRSSSLGFAIRPPSPSFGGSPLRIQTPTLVDLDEWAQETSPKGNKRASYSRSSVPIFSAASPLFVSDGTEFTRALSARENPRTGSVLPLSKIEKPQRPSLSMPVVLHVRLVTLYARGAHKCLVCCGTLLWFDYVVVFKRRKKHCCRFSFHTICHTRRNVHPNEYEIIQHVQ